MGSHLKQQLVAAATEFATKVATAVEMHQAADAWVDQDTCAPLTKRKFLGLVARGELAARVVGKQRLVRRRDLDRFIDRHSSRERHDSAARTDAQIEAEVLVDLDLAPAPTKEKA